jgi:hypothetical protein
VTLHVRASLPGKLGRRLALALVNPTRSLGPLLLVPLAIGIAVADDESDRRDLIGKIEGKLEYAAGELSGLESDSSASDVDDALSYIREVESYIDQLSRVKGSDSTASTMVSYYPGYIQDFRVAAEELKKLKGKQDDAKKTIDTCDKFDEEMTRKAQATKDDPRGAEELADLAGSVGRKGEEIMKEAERRLSEVERHRDDVKRFSASDGKWSSVRSYMHYSADAIARIHKDDVEKARRECEEVVKREHHKEVAQALGRLANSRTGRSELRKKLDELLVTLSDRINDVQSQSGTSYVNGAIEISKEIESQLERLKNAQGDDEESKRIASSWPQWTRDLRTSLESLKEMKTNQNRADDGDEKCVSLEKSLQETIRGYVGNPEAHENALKSLPDEADRIGAPIAAGIAKATEVDRQMADWHARAKSFSQSEGNWSRATSNLKSSADRVYDHWKAEYASMIKACERLVRGRDNPDVKKAVDEMQRDTSAAADSYKALRDEFGRWKAEVDKLRDWSNEDLEEIRKAFCAAPDADEIDEATKVADRWASQIANQYGTVTGQADRIKRAADDLVSKGRAKKNGPKVKDAVDKILTTLAKLKDHQMKGSNDPLFKAQAAYGVKQHQALQGSLGCDKTELTISSKYCSNPVRSGSNCKLDCLKGCQVIEIKPEGAKTLGDEQGKSYQDGLERMYSDLGETMFSNDFKTLKQCVSSDKKELVLTYEVTTYSFCPTKADVGYLVPLTSGDIPEQAE